MKITIDTTKKELVIEHTTSVSELIEFLEGYKDYTIISNTIVLNSPATTPYRSPFGNPATTPYRSPFDDEVYPYNKTTVMYNT